MENILKDKATIRARLRYDTCAGTMVRALMEKAYNMGDQMGNFSTWMETMRERKKNDRNGKHSNRYRMLSAGSSH